MTTVSVVHLSSSRDALLSLKPLDAPECELITPADGMAFVIHHLQERRFYEVTSRQAASVNCRQQSDRLTFTYERLRIRSVGRVRGPR
ncbi:MAG: hypothetical protein GXY52_04970 [Chloroflexi bacterium]|nr:hypothetical protein [Chloroflexota bacterium]